MATPMQKLLLAQRQHVEDLKAIEVKLNEFINTLVAKNEYSARTRLRDLCRQVAEVRAARDGELWVNEQLVGEFRPKPEGGS